MRQTCDIDGASVEVHAAPSKGSQCSEVQAAPMATGADLEVHAAPSDKRQHMISGK